MSFMKKCWRSFGRLGSAHRCNREIGHSKACRCSCGRDMDHGMMKCPDAGSPARLHALREIANHRLDPTNSPEEALETRPNGRKVSLKHEDNIANALRTGAPFFIH